MVRAVIMISLFALSIVGFQLGVASAIELRVTYSPTNLSEMYKALVQAFEKKHPDIQVILTGYPSYDDLSQQNLRSAITGDLPDVSHEGLFNIRVYSDRELAVPLDSFISSEPDWKDLSNVSRVGQINGVTYAIPFSISTQNIFLNLNLVARAGGDPNNLPQDWDGILELARKIEALDEKSSGIFFDYQANAALAFQTLLFSQGGTMMDATDKDVTLDSPQGLWAMQLIQKFGQAGQPDLSRTDARQAFAAGYLGIYQNTSFIIANFDKQITAFEYRVIPVPTAPGGLLPASGNAMVMFSRDPERQKAAWEYMKFASSVEGQSIMARMTGYVPVNSKVVEDPEMKTFYESNPHFAVPLTQIKNLTGWYRFPGQNAERIADEIIEEMRNVVKLKKTPEEALKSAAATARELLN